MKTSSGTTLAQRAVVVAIAALATFAGLPVSAATTSFPQYPLLTGGNSIPPNILLILDDSGSMEGPWMTADKNGTVDKDSLSDNVTDRSYVNNTLYYDPRKDYLPWRTASTDLNARLADADFKNAASSTTSPTASKVDLRNDSESYFYVPKVANPGTNSSNYNKYRVGTSSASGSYSGGAVQIKTSSSNVTLINTTTVASINATQYSSCISVDAAPYDSVVITTSGGSGDGDLYMYTNATCNGGTNSTSTSGNNNESITYTGNAATISFRIYAYSKVTNITYKVTATTSWSDQTPTGRSQQDELQNFANWYQYHRTRNKMAKAGASEAFGRLGKNYRVGFDTIWNRGGSSSNTDGSAPAFAIPYDKNNGLFEDNGTVTNRSTFFTRLQGAGASSNTPLKGALQRAARYFATDNPWKNSDGTTLTCRQNYAILTTDGYWNANDGFNSDSIKKYSDNTNAGDGNGDVDRGRGYPYQDKSSGGYSNTLADVAYYYWKNDLKTGSTWPNNVKSNAADGNATWQHMVTFGVSIGLQGTLDPGGNPPATWPDPISNSGAQRIDDLWHASINGHGSFVVAADTDRFASALISALATIDARNASGSNIASSSTKTDTSTLTFVAGFTSSTWTGDLIASPFNAGLTGVSNTALWTLSTTFGSGGANVSFSGRTILTMKGGVASTFGTSMSGASDLSARNGQVDEVSYQDNIDYLKGVQTKEIGRSGGTLRKRTTPVGDIVDSSPAYVLDTNTVYIGANDGMMHGIDASNGKVLFSYVPKGIDYAALASLSSTSYEHRYFVDGQIDVVSQSVQGNSKNILVGALGRGGRGVFGLDVTTPTSMTTSKVLWDNTTQDSTTEKDMGYVLGSVRIRKGNTGKLYAFVPNGIDSPNGSAALFVYELSATGSIASTTKLVVDSAGGNGLMGLGMADLNADGKVDYVYGGDLKGNVWRWDMTSTTALPSAATKLFRAVDSAGNGQPITGGIGVGRDLVTGTVFVGFGTGRFISSSDVPGVATQTTQSLYGIADSATTVSGRTDLQARTIPFSGTTASGEAARGFENYSALPSGKKGWYIDMTVPERVISAPTIYGSAMFVSSVIPATGSDCEGVTGSGFLNAINLFTGTSPQTGGYFSETWTTTGGGILGSIGISGGMPTEVNVTNSLATVGTGAFSSEGGGNTTSKGIVTPSGGIPKRINWREIVPLQ